MTPLAALFTILGRWYVLAGVAALAAIATIAWHGDLRVVVALYAVQLLAQAAVAAIKLVFRRPRPARWLVVHERDFSYPSGHAATAIVMYLSLVLLVVSSGIVPHVARVPLALLLAACVVGIPWARLALGAHYLSDVIGGLLFGCGWSCAAFAIAAHLTARMP